MKKLGKRNYLLISRSMKTLGFDNPEDGMMNEEEMYINEAKEIWKFLEWLHKIDRSFGRINYEERFAEFKRGDVPEKSWFELRIEFPAHNHANFSFPSHSHIKRISTGDHKDMIALAARSCSNLDDPTFFKVIKTDKSYEKEYDLKEMKQFIEDNAKAIREYSGKYRDQYPNEFF